MIGMGPSALAAFDDAYDTVVHTTARRDRLDEAIAGLYHDGELAPTARRLACLRGVSALTAVSLAVEIGDWSRFKGSTIACLPRPGPLRAPLRGSRPASRGPITKTREHPRPAPADRGRLAPRPRLPALQGHTGALGPGPRTGRGTGRCRQPPPDAPATRP